MSKVKLHMGRWIEKTVSKVEHWSSGALIWCCIDYGSHFE